MWHKEIQKAVKYSRREVQLQWRQKNTFSSYAAQVLNSRKEEIMRDRLRHKVDGSLLACIPGKGSWKQWQCRILRVTFYHWGWASISENLEQRSLSGLGKKQIFAFLHQRIIYFQNQLVFVFYACDLINACISLLNREPYKSDSATLIPIMTVGSTQLRLMVLV